MHLLFTRQSSRETQPRREVEANANLAGDPGTLADRRAAAVDNRTGEVPANDKQHASTSHPRRHDRIATYMITVRRGGRSVGLVRRLGRMTVPIGIRRRRLLVIGLARVASVRRMGLVLVMHRTATAESVSSTRAQKSPMARDRRQSKRTGTAAGDKIAEAEGTRGRPSMAGSKTWLGREEDVKRKKRRR